MSDTDWIKVRRSVKRAAPNWYALGDNLPYTLAEALRRDRIVAMRGVKVRTRNTDRRGGKRFCSIYLKEDDSAGGNQEG